MNEYDSARMPDVLREKGLSHGCQMNELTDCGRRRDVMLLNTCSIREKAQEKVFSPARALEALEARKPRAWSSASAAASPARRARPSASARPTWTWCSARRPCTGCRRCSSRVARGGSAGGRRQFPGDREVRPPAGARADGPTRLRLDHGGLLQVLHLLRRALHPRRGDQPALRRRHRRGRRPRRSRACARSICSGRTSTPTAARCTTARSPIWPN
jgi:hypothetical protein